MNAVYPAGIMKVGVPAEVASGERRVALVPDGATKLGAAGLQVHLQAGAGSEAFYPDDTYQKAGATIVAQARDLLKDADVILKVQPPTLDEVALLKPGALLISFLQTSANAEVVKALARQKVTAFSLELVPRISRAQSMDALSSQAGVAGYKAVLMAANRLGRFFPLLITAAGTVTPAKVLVLGAGVAGLQAIATARRLGAVVEAYDVRPAVKEEVKSLGASFVELALEAQEGQGGYAREQSEEFLRRQRELIGAHVAAADVVITTAAIPGRRAPILVTKEIGDAYAAGLRRRRPGRRHRPRTSRPPGRARGSSERGRRRRDPKRGQHHAGACEPALQPERQQPLAAAGQGWQAQSRLQRRDRQGQLPDPRRRDGPSPRQRTGRGEVRVNAGLFNEFTFFILAIFVGIEVISKVPTILHTPLMSGTNAIHGIILVGAILIAASADNPVQIILGLVAVTLATINVVGGFVVTDRMLEMFKGRQAPPRKEKP